MCYNVVKGETAMRTAPKFDKVSWKIFEQNGTREIYDGIKLPRRATAKSAGYDFFAPTELNLSPNETVTVATGIRALMPDDACLLIFPRSGLGFKYRLRLNNTVGVIDADYCDSDNEGHIFVRMTNESDKPLHLNKGAAFAQGIFVRYLLAENDDATETRNGGLGSTGE